VTARRSTLGLALALAAASAVTATGREAEAGAAHVRYFGGRVISRVQVVVVLWGAVDATVAQALGPFYETVTGGAYFDWLGEYDTAGVSVTPGGVGAGTQQHVGRGTYLTTVSISPAAGSGDLLDSDVRTELANDLGNGVLPAPRVDAEGGVDTLYVVYLPPGASLVGPGGSGISCAQFCGYHDTFSAGGLKIPYAVIPDMTAAGCMQACGSGDALDHVTLTSSHELAEAVTDPETHTASGVGRTGVAAWYDDANGEIGDICDLPGNAASIGGYAVQLLWSQRTQACIAQDPGLPVCGASRPCRPCTAGDCGGATPVCDPATGACVAAGPLDAGGPTGPLRATGSGCTAAPDGGDALSRALILPICCLALRRRRRAGQRRSDSRSSLRDFTASPTAAREASVTSLAACSTCSRRGSSWSQRRRASMPPR
jgi:hypothetical protein